MKGIPAVSVKTKWVVLLCFIYRHHDKSQRPKGEEKNRVDGMLSLGDNKLVEIFMITETKVQHATCGFCGSFWRRGRSVYKGQPASWNLSWILVIMSWFGCLSALRLSVYV